MKNLTAYIMMALVALVFASCAGGNSGNGDSASADQESPAEVGADQESPAEVGADQESPSELTLAKYYVILNGADIKVESGSISWSEDKKTGTIQNYYINEKFKLTFTDLQSRIVDGPEKIHGQEFPIIINYNDQDYQATVIIENSEKGETNKYIGTEYLLIGKVNAFDMGDTKVTGGQFSFSTYLNE